MSMRRDGSDPASPSLDLPVENWRVVFAIMAFSGIVPAVQIMAPGVALQLSRELHLGATQIGWLFAAELGMMSFATIPAYIWIRRLDWHVVALTAGLIFISSNLLSLVSTTLHWLLLTRSASGLAGGTLMVITLAAGVQTKNRARTYGLWLCAQFIVGAIGLLLMPLVFPRWGIAACFLALAGLMAVALPLVRDLPRGEPMDAAVIGEDVSVRAGARARAIAGMVAIVTFYIGLSGVWTFIGFAAKRAGVRDDASAAVLAVATLMGILGATLASLLGGRIGRGKALLLGYVLMIAAIMAFSSSPGPALFMSASLLFKFTWTFSMPFILAAISALDGRGTLTGASNLAIGSGLTAGPMLAGVVLDANKGDFGQLLALASAIVLVSLICALFCASGLPDRAKSA